MEGKAYVISANMGYGHQRTAFALRNLAEGEIINANNYPGIPEKDRKIWENIRIFYEFISNLYRIPLIGSAAFEFFDRFQRIQEFYPKRGIQKPNFQLKQTLSLIKRGWGKHLIEKLKTQNSKLKTNLPIISTFFIPAFMAEFFDYPGEIFCVVCDADISRSWAPLNPRKSRIKYFVPTKRVVERLRFYGVKPENIIFSGYPLPLENIGTENLEVLKDDLRYRLLNLDPQKRYFEKYKVLIEENLGSLPEKPDHPLTIMFSVGGVGAQKEIGVKVLRSLNIKIKTGEIKIILSAGIREEVKRYFKTYISQLKFKENKNRSVDQSTEINFFNLEIIFDEEIARYFEKFNLALRKTDILWTKPSELSFYTALGIPIIIAPPIGSQEEFNLRWLLKSGFGILQRKPEYTDEWFFDWLDSGYLAEAAMQGFIEGEKLGTFKILHSLE